MLIVADVGNTNATLGLFDQERLIASWRLLSDTEKTADEYAVLVLSLLRAAGYEPEDVDEAILGSVVPPLTSVFAQVFRRYFNVDALVVEAGIRTGVRILMDNPKEVGADRIVNTVAAYRIYGGPTIIVDFGTATTFDIVSREGDYLGGVIAPGLTIAADALFQRTAKLLRVDLVKPRTVIGKSTVTAIQAGLVFGYVGLVDGIIARIQAEVGGGARVIATGGQAPVIARESAYIERVDDDLTLVGLRFLHELNRRERV
jgi:type III pantothenate kinase